MLIIKNIGKLGLQNNGNTCYLNSCLQLLTHCGFFTLEIYKFYKKRNNNEDLKPIEKYLLELILNKWFSNETIFNPIKIHKEISKENDIFNPIYCEQHDSSEFLIYVLNELNDKLKNIFNSKFISIIKCKICKNIRKKEEDFLIWSIELHEHINSSIKSFFNLEDIDDVYCENCKTKTKCTKKYEYKKVSDSLIIHLKRFKPINNKYVKINNKIHTNDVITINKNNYELRGVIVHMGSINHGHYIFLGKNLNNKWLNYNDSICNNIMYNNPIEQGYIFYYEKITNHI